MAKSKTILATVIKPIQGKFSQWQVGEVVRATKTGERCLIERIKWRGQLPILNQCGGVPASALEALEFPKS